MQVGARPRSRILDTSAALVKNLEIANEEEALRLKDGLDGVEKGSLGMGTCSSSSSGDYRVRNVLTIETLQSKRSQKIPSPGRSTIDRAPAPQLIDREGEMPRKPSKKEKKKKLQQDWLNRGQNKILA